MPHHRPHLRASSLGALALAGLLAACGGGPQEAVTAAPSHSASRSWTPPGPPHDPWGPWIREASRRYDVPERWIREVMRQESGGRARATSPVGAMGLMQVMPGTYAELRRRHGLGDDPYHPYDNLMAGTAYIRQMYDLYGSPAFLAAYNAGPRRLEDYLYNSRGLPAETRNYVARVGPRVITASPSRRAPAEVYAAAEIPLHVPPGPRRMDSATQTMLAEQRSIREGNAQFAGRAEPEPAPRAVAVAQAPRPAPLPGSSLLAGAAGGFVPGSVRAMDPIPDGSTPEGAARLAASEGRAWGGGGGEEQRVVVARMDPIPDGSTPEGAARLAEFAARQAAPSEPAPVPRFVEARRPEPTPRSSTALAEARPLPAPVPAGGTRASLAAQPIPPPPPRSLGFVSVAQAGTLPANFRAAASGAAPSQWGVQVGAFSSENLARSAAQQAQQGGVGGRVAVEPVTVGRSRLYRARVVGLTQTAAQQACDRLRARGGCQVVSPET